MVAIYCTWNLNGNKTQLKRKSGLFNSEFLVGKVFSFFNLKTHDVTRNKQNNQLIIIIPFPSLLKT